MQPALITISCFNSLFSHINQTSVIGISLVCMCKFCSIFQMLLFHRSSSFFEAGRYLQETTWKVEGRDIHKLTKYKALLNNLFTWEYKIVVIASKCFGKSSKLFWMSWKPVDNFLIVVRIKHGKQATWKSIFYAINKWGH